MWRAPTALGANMTGVWVLLGAVLVAVAAGLVLRARNGKLRKARATALPPKVTELIDPAARVTLLQVSTQFCAPCKHAATALKALANDLDGVHHVDLDVTDEPQLAERLNVLSTPTTLALTHQGTELFRFSGLPRVGELTDRLTGHAH